MAQYLGDEKINEVVPVEGTGESIVSMKNGPLYTLPDAVLDKMITEEKVDWRGASVNDYKLGVISEDLLGLLRDHYKIGCKELERLLIFITNKSNNDFNVAQQLLWGKGVYDIKLLDVSEVLKNGSEKEKQEAQVQASAFNRERAGR